jgi:hypothetical protein
MGREDLNVEFEEVETRWSKVNVGKI